MTRKLHALLPAALQNVDIVLGAPPATRNDVELPFGGMSPGAFELFCCELLAADAARAGAQRRLLRIEPLAGGQSQYGADIFVQQGCGAQTRTILYEVKRVKDFGPAGYTAAVERFAANRARWPMAISEFVVISADPVSSALLAEWHVQRLKYLSQDVELGLWSAYVLHRKVRDFPALVYRFFHPVWTEMMFGPASRRHFELYGKQEPESSEAWDGYLQPYCLEQGDRLDLMNEHVRLQVRLPAAWRDGTSCLLQLRNPYYSRMLISLAQRDLINRYFAGSGSPPELGLRRFLLKTMGTGWYCDLGGCRLELSGEETEALFDALDQYAAVYVRRLAATETLWKSTDFELQGGAMGSAVPLVCIQRGLLNLLNAYAHEHDVFSSKLEGSMFDSSGDGIKVITLHPDRRYEPGYHAFIKPYRVNTVFTHFSCPDNEVVLAWLPPDKTGYTAYEGKIGGRYYWDALTTFEFLRYEMIPRALYWDQYERKKVRRRPRFDDFLASWEARDYIAREYYAGQRQQPPSERRNVASLLALASEIQRYFSITRGYVSPTEFNNLYQALAIMLHWPHQGYFGYFLAKLPCDGEDIPALAAAVADFGQRKMAWSDNHFMLDCTSRCLLEILKKLSGEVSGAEIAEVAALLQPLETRLEQAALLKRQQLRLMEQA